MDNGGEVNLFTRPRRFGKTLILSMLKTFFEKEYGWEKELLDNSSYFEGKKIMEAGERYTSELGKYHVISLSLKSAKQPDFQMAYVCLVDEITKEYRRHSYVLDGNSLTNEEKAKYDAIVNETALGTDYAKLIQFLSICLEKYHHEKAIILIDEYDVPLENAYYEGFYQQMIQFIQSLFESCLKTNDSLRLAVITGCLRISKESIFTGLNNLKINSILNDSYGEYFGFIQEEIDEILSYYELEEKTEEVRNWYNGYLFGETQVYNPWSMINYVDDRNEFPKPYWSNTSSNSIVRDLVERADDSQKEIIETLISGGNITIPVHEDITYDEVYESEDNLWNFLFFTGYLKAKDKYFDEDTIYLVLEIPNAEVRYIYRNTITTWFKQKIKETDRSKMFTAIVSGEVDIFTEELQTLLGNTISFYDYAENFYHGFLAGVLTGMKGYIIKSNRVAGKGRSDVFVYPVSRQKEAYVLEFKIAHSIAEMQKKAEEAIQQIIDKQYEKELESLGYAQVKRYEIAFFEKDCLVITK